MKAYLYSSSLRTFEGKVIFEVANLKERGLVTSNRGEEKKGLKQEICSLVVLLVPSNFSIEITFPSLQFESFRNHHLNLPTILGP